MAITLFSLSILPLCLAFAAFFCGWFSLTLSSPSAKRILPFPLFTALVAFHRQNELSVSRILNEMFGRLVIVWALYMAFLVYVKGYDGARHTLYGQGHDHPVSRHDYLTWSDPKKPFRSRFQGLRRYIFHLLQTRGRCAFKMVFNGRGIGTDWQVPTLPTPRRSNTLFSLLGVPWGFLLRRAIGFTAKALVWWVWTKYSAYFLSMEELDYQPEKRILIRRLLCTAAIRWMGVADMCHWSPVTLRELNLRFWIVVDNNFRTIIVLNLFHDVLAIIFVGIGYDCPDEWPPFFGSILDAYTVRGYWAKFWQVLMHRMLSGYSTTLLHHVFHLHERTRISHMIHGGLVFGMSGLYHAIIYHYTMPACDKLQVVVYYAIQPVAFIIESLALRAWRNLREGTADSRFPKTKLESVLTRLVGYVWVFFWFFWLEPKLILAANYEIRQHWKNWSSLHYSNI